MTEIALIPVRMLSVLALGVLLYMLVSGGWLLWYLRRKRTLGRSPFTATQRLRLERTAPALARQGRWCRLGSVPVGLVLAGVSGPVLAGIGAGAVATIGVLLGFFAKNFQWLAQDR